MSGQWPGHVMDGTIAAGALTSPLWVPIVHYLSEIIGLLTVFGGFILVIIRILLALKELGKKDGPAK